jgi:hypothetical protein
MFTLTELWNTRNNCCRPSQSRRKRDTEAIDTVGVSSTMSVHFVEPSEFGDQEYQTSPRRCVRMQHQLPWRCYIPYYLGAASKIFTLRVMAWGGGCVCDNVLTFRKETGSLTGLYTCII